MDIIGDRNIDSEINKYTNMVLRSELSKTSKSIFI